MNEQDAKAWKEDTAHMIELDKKIQPALAAIRAVIEPEYSALQERVDEIKDRTGDISVCEFCDESFEFERADYVYADTDCCPACGQARRDEMEKCDHQFMSVETDDGPGIDCTRCACQILEEDAERFLGPERHALFQAGRMRAEREAA